MTDGGKDRPPRNRTDMTQRTGEAWRPPAYSAPGERPVTDVLRRFLDLQAGSVWRDLAGQLPLVHGRVLDVGCGAQPYRKLFGPEASYQGIDVASAKANFGYEVPDTTYFEGDAWPVADQSIDFVLCTETMEHVPDPRKLLGEAARCLKPGGRILLTTPFSARWHYIPHDYWRYTPSCLGMLFSESGFAGAEVYARGNPITVFAYKAMALALPVIMPQRKGPLATWLLRLLSILLIPYLIFFAVIGNISLMGRGGDDCLGYTAMGVKKS
jgi:ubiquinone/menaquinone biosynthesis C-methylase UbiE